MGIVYVSNPVILPEVDVRCASFSLVFLEGLGWFRCRSMGVCEANSDIKKVIKKRFQEEAPCVFVCVLF